MSLEADTISSVPGTHVDVKSGMLLSHRYKNGIASTMCVIISLTSCVVTLHSHIVTGSPGAWLPSAQRAEIPVGG
jgi:hypothetical protein